VTGGRYGNALSLNGSSYLSSPADPNETQYAVSLWFKLALSEAEVTSQANGTLFAVNDAHGTQVYLSGGKVCADVYYTSSPETRCSTATSFNDNTWHHVVHTFGSVVGSQKLYVDGVQVASGTATGSAMANTNGVFVGHSTLAGRVNFNGLLDDVRLYDSALTAAQVRGLFNRPVFDMKFENPATTASGYQWTDTSIFGITGQCTGSHCPTSTTGIAGQGVQFDGSNKYISVGDNSNLDLSEGHFTIAAWIKPGTTSADTAPCLEYAYEGINMICVAFQPEGILGWKSGTGDAYATLQRQTIYHMDADPYLTGLYDRVRFGFATTSGWMGYYESPYGVLNAGAWNHVALTFGDGMVKLYVNGELKDTNTAVFAGKTPSVTKRLEIGASSRDGKVTFSSVDVWHEHDPGSAELCMACGGTQIFNGDVNGDNTYSINAQCPFTDEATLQIWENDSDPKCGSAANGDDQAIASHTFKITDGGMPTNPPVVCTTPFYSCTCPDAECLSFDGDVMGYVHFQYKHDSLPYRGTVDEVQIYRQVLDGESIKNLYRSLNTALHLRLDDPPGETTFMDASPNARNGSCTGAACPIAGITGRVSQAAAFKPAEHDRIELPNFGNFTNATVAAWVYRTESTTGRVTIVSYKEDQACGFTLALEPSGSDYDPKFYVRVGSSWQSVQQSVNVPLNTWVHLAGSYDGQTIRLYRNGAEVASLAAAGAMTQCTGNTAIGSRSSKDMHFFGGRIDDVYIFSRELSATEVASLYNEAPVLELRFDEAQGATQFSDNTNNANNGTCVTGSCPLAGEGVQGQMGLAAQFDGSNDEVTVPDSATLHPSAFTVGAWVMPTAIRTGVPQELMVRSYSNPGGTLGPQPTSLTNYRLYIAPDGLTPVAEFSASCSEPNVQVSSAVSLVKDHWNHVMATYDGTRLSLYVNGTEQGHWLSTDIGYPSIPACQTPDVPLNVGDFSVDYGGGYVDRSNPFAGRLDEVTLYNRALSEAEVNDIYRYQFGWVEERRSSDITVDTNDPTSELHAPATYLPASGMMLLATTNDDTSGVAGVELGSCKSTGSCAPGGWASADRCQGTGDGAWCPYFTPSGEGRYVLKARASDKVGHSAESSNSVIIYVDDHTSASLSARRRRSPALPTARAWTRCFIPLDRTPGSST
jgi:hypothetical protein